MAKNEASLDPLGVEYLSAIVPKLAVDSLLDIAIIAVDFTATIRWVSSAASTLFGYFPPELVGKPLALLLPDSIKEDHEKFIRSYFADPKARPMGVGLTLKGRRRSGIEIPVEISLTPVKVRDVTMVIAVVRQLDKNLDLPKYLSSLQAAAHPVVDLTEQYEKEKSRKEEKESNGSRSFTANFMRIETPWFGMSMTGQNLIGLLVAFVLFGFVAWEHYQRGVEHDEILKTVLLNNYLILAPQSQRAALAPRYEQWIDEQKRKR